MTGDADAFTARLAALQHSLEYYAVTGGTRSPTYRLDVRLQPRLAGIELVYTNLAQSISVGGIELYHVGQFVAEVLYTFFMPMVIW